MARSSSFTAHINPLGALQIVLTGPGSLTVVGLGLDREVGLPSPIDDVKIQRWPNSVIHL